jgi:uncharacterized membrane protein YeiH
MSGALAAGRRNMDTFGVTVIAFVTAPGGGTIRDLPLGRFPIGWTQHPEYVYLVISAGLLTTVIASFMHNLKRVFLVLDAMGLIAFSLIGCSLLFGERIHASGRFRPAAIRSRDGLPDHRRHHVRHDHRHLRRHPA